MSELKLDPLYVIFEQHLYDFNDNTETESAFIEKVVRDYLKFLNANGAIVPPKMINLIAEELNDQVRNMLRKKMYGCLTIDEFKAREQQNGVRDRRRRARRF